MMGNKGTVEGDEYDAFSRRARRIVPWGRGRLKKVKRKFWKRERRSAARRARDEAARRC
mgnify:CR=1 FL=1